MTSSRTSPRNRDSRCARWSLTLWVIHYLSALHLIIGAVIPLKGLFNKRVLGLCAGSGYGHVKTHEFTGGPENNGGNEKSDQLWSSAAG